MHNNPVNNIDPSGKMVAVGSMPDLITTIAIISILVATTVVVTNREFQRANEQLMRALISSTVAVMAAMGQPFKDFWQQFKEWIKNQWNKFKQYFKDRGGFYLHYGYQKHWAFFLTLGLKPNGYATRDVYVDGWMAKTFLALPHPNPPDAVYIIWPKKGFKPTYQGVVAPAFGMPGLGYEYKFGKGSGGPGTVFGPIPIPKGTNPLP